MDDLFIKPRELVARARKERTETDLCTINEFTAQIIISFNDTIFAMRLFLQTIPKPLKQHPL